MIELLEGLLGKSAQIVHEPFHAAEMRETQADITKARDLLGWAPTVRPEEGFKRTVEWYLANRDWLHVQVAPA